MPKRTEPVVCAGCAKPISLGSESRAAGVARCRPCRLAENAERRAQSHGASGYTRGCRCDICKRAAYARNRERYWKLKGQPTQATCMICGSAFIKGPALGGRNNAAKTCSVACASKRDTVGTWNYQTRKRGAFVAEVVAEKIHERDRWRCYRCHRRLRPTTQWPHPRTATIDHLIPLSRGGTHEPANVRTCCLNCNVSKGNRGGNEQLLLIG